MKISSSTYHSRNAEGMVQIDIEYERSFFDSIFLRRRVRSFERWPTGFRDKVTGEYAGIKERFEIAKVLAAHHASQN